MISLNALDSDGESALARQCQYTAIMNGTSAATPMISGVAALMLEANPNLGYRDVKYILAKTAKRIDPTYSPVTYDYGGSRITLDSGWVQNAAGFWFSTWYGFGAVDATAAVIMAKTYINYLPPIVESGTVSVAQTAITVPYTANGSAVTFSVSASMKAVEHVQLYLSIPQAPTNGLMCNQVQLTSPSGTTSILMHAGTGFGSYSAVGSNATPQTSVSTAQLLSNAFYGESAAGVWGLQILDLCSSGTGTILPAGTAQVLTISGH